MLRWKGVRSSWILKQVNTDVNPKLNMDLLRFKMCLSGFSENPSHQNLWGFKLKLAWNDSLSLCWDVPFIGEAESHPFMVGSGSPLPPLDLVSASCASQGAGMAASFSTRVSIKEPPPELLLEQPSLRNFAEFVWIHWAVTLLQGSGERHRVAGLHTGSPHSFQSAGLGNLFWIECAPTSGRLPTILKHCHEPFLNEQVLTGIPACSPPLPSSRFSLHQTCCSHLEWKRTVHLSRLQQSLLRCRPLSHLV